MNPVDGTIIEQHKENITPLPGGRPVSKLAANFSIASKSLDQYRQKQNIERNDFESSLLQADELDDPLEVYIEYIKWTHDNYPQGANSESGLVSLLERCTSCFRDTEYYKNDPRYLKVWLEYINYSDSPREIFIYLSKKEIGNKLALFYEEFAKYLEITGKLNDAKQVYELGIELNARPLLRLRKTFENFLERRETTNLSPSTIRNALSVKRGGNPPPLQEQVSNPRKRQKIEIFNDNDTPTFKESLLDTSSVKEIGSIKSRIKENVFTPKPWLGEVIKQSGNNSRPTSKFEVFRDDDVVEKNEVVKNETDGLYYTIIRQPGKNTEKVWVNMDLVYPSPEEEYCFEEILALNRRFKKDKTNDVKHESGNNSILVGRKDDRKDVNGHDLNIQSKEDDFGRKHCTYPTVLKDGSHTTNSNYNTATKVEIPNEIDHTFTIALKDDTSMARPNSPTITMYSRMATNDVYKMFNEAANNLNTDDEFDTKTEHDNTTNYDEFVTETIRLPPISKETEEVTTPPTDHYDTDDEIPRSTQSSPFIERPSNVNLGETVNVSNPELKGDLISSLNPPISSYPGYFRYRTKINKLSNINQITNHKSKIISKGPSSIINYCGDEIYCLRYELGRGGYGVVYLIETELGIYKALKIESPASQWEFYILSEIHKRVPKCMRTRFISAESLSYFEDESYLVLNYCNQGTLLDVVNFYKNQDKVVDEVLCIFLTIELLKIVESLHEVEIIHGDLKADNCMVRFEEQDIEEKYEPDGSGGWDSKGITLIDFGRAIDITRFKTRPTGFVSDWETDEQDCPQMRDGRTWMYEADYYGIAAIIHTLLFGDYIETKKVDNRYKLSNNFKRYWQVQLWMPLFDLLLNPYCDEEHQTPKAQEIKLQRDNLEQWLTANSSSKQLKRIINEIGREVNAENRKRIRSLR